MLHEMTHGIDISILAPFRHTAIHCPAPRFCKDIEVGLEGGDLIFTGTPEGVGRLNRGDRLSGHIDGVARIDLDIG